LRGPSYHDRGGSFESELFRRRGTAKLCPMSSPAMSAGAPFGAVVIGRNEGERLRVCLEAVLRSTSQVIYVDSGSTDGSPALAQRLGVEVVPLDLSIPFTAARARNAGWERLMEVAPDLTLVQFVDGDCEVVAGWTDVAVARLAQRPELAVVCGRRRERHPEASIYNQLCDIEWNTPVGDAVMCGGDAMMRLPALQAVGGFDPNLIAGEEPELCVRLRARGYGIERIDAEMTLHDAAMTRFGQWWRRNVRAGHAYAEGAALHGQPLDRRGVRSIAVWAAAVPAIALGAAVPTGGTSLLLLGGYVVQAARIHRGLRRGGWAARTAALGAAFMVLGKFPGLQGIVKYRWSRARGRRSALIEYKQPAPGAASVAASAPLSGASGSASGPAEAGGRDPVPPQTR
jgi:Glycosyl transferase family 2